MDLAFERPDRVEIIESADLKLSGPKIANAIFETFVVRKDEEDASLVAVLDTEELNANAPQSRCEAEVWGCAGLWRCGLHSVVHCRKCGMPTSSAKTKKEYLVGGTPLIVALSWLNDPYAIFPTGKWSRNDHLIHYFAPSAHFLDSVLHICTKVLCRFLVTVSSHCIGAMSHNIIL